MMEEETFELIYLCHPTNDLYNEQQQQQQPFGGGIDFYQFGLQQHHALHRWTGQDKILILKPGMDSIKKKIFSAGGKSTADIFQAKQLLSACAIAFQNVGCYVPVFVPVGQSRHDMYIGYMLNASTDNHFSETETRFNMSLTTPPNFQLSYLDGLKTLFLQKLNTYYEDHGIQGDMRDKELWVSAVYTYNLQNWFDENWKEWDDEKQTVNTKRKNSFSDDFESWGDDDDNDNEEVKDDMISQQEQEQSKQNGQNQLNQHKLQFGSFNDPLRSLTLSALFPMSQENLFDDAYQTNMDALTAKQWQISRELAPLNQQRAYLSTLIGQAVESWIKDPSNKDYLAPYDDSNDDSTSDGISLMRNLFVAGNNPTVGKVNILAGDPQQVNFFKPEQVDNVITALFDAGNSTLNEYINILDSKIKYMTTETLGLRLKTNTSVPYRSFLWNLFLYCLEEESFLAESGKKQNSSNFLGFLKIVWMEVLRKFRWHWENLVPIPNLNPYLYDTRSTKSSDNHSKILGIDLRYNILHQKISMLNCCILRRLQNSPQNGIMEDLKPKKSVSNLFDTVSLNQEQEQKKSRASKIQSLIEKFVDGVASESGVIEDSISFEASDIEDGNSEDSDVFLDAIEDGSIGSGESDMSDNTVKESQKVKPSNTMAESFVNLPHISTTSDKDVPEAKAGSIEDPHVAEGESHVHDSLKLLKTGECMKVPITQDPGFMTEDMISEQADVFESLGTSENATHQRAKLQSAQLFSDMQAFKAANPYACLEDFVRWHSPRDWIADDGEEGGHLSTRMSEPNNIWQELWKCSERIPCSRQKPLFNMAVEAEKALYFLETTSVHELFSIMLPTVGLIAYDTLSTHPIVNCSKLVCEELNSLGSELIKFPWDDLRHGKQTFDSVITRVRRQESMMCHAISLLRKLPGQYKLVDKLLFHDRATVEEGDERSSVFQLFRDDQGIISQPSFREYVLYSECKDLTSVGRILPQRQYALVKDTEVRILDLKTIDSLYT